MTAAGQQPAEPPAPTVGGREVHVDLDPELEPLLAALYGPTWRYQLAHRAAAQLDDQGPPR